jgi:hypothetical protein
LDHDLFVEVSLLRDNEGGHEFLRAPDGTFLIGVALEENLSGDRVNHDDGDTLYFRRRG